MEYLLLFFVLFLVIGFLTLVGHGLWLFCAFIFHGLFGAGKTKNLVPFPEERCAQCGHEQPHWERYCLGCGLDRMSAKAEELADLRVTLRQLHRFWTSGVVDQATYDQLLIQIAGRRRHLTGHFAPVPATPQRPEEEIPTVLPVEEIIFVRPASVEIVPPIQQPGESLVRASPEPAAAFPTLVDETPALEVRPVAAPVLVGNSQVEQAPLPRAPAPPPRPPRKSLGEVLAAFMEERNILWGELVGGLLIVGCSIALVISLWNTLEQIQYFPFLLFAVITSSLFGAGLYTLHHWKLESTSRGLLGIATLLVPLTFLVMAGLHRKEGGDWLELLLNGVFLAVFAWLLSLAARVLVPEGRWLLPVAVAGTSATQLLVPWLINPQHSKSWIIVLGAMAVAFHGAAIGGILFRLRPARGSTTALTTLSRRQGQSLLVFLGIATFALAAALGLVLFRNGENRAALNVLAVLGAVAGIPILVGGLTVHEGLASDPDSGSLRTAGTAVAFGGILVLLIGLGLAWPQPWPLVLVGLLDFVVLAWVAFRHRLPLAHGVGIPCLAVSYVAAFILWHGQLEVDRLGPSMMEQVGAPETGAALIGLFAVLGGVSEILVRCRRRVDAIYFAAGCGLVVLVSLILVTLPPRGIEFPIRPLVVNAVYGVCLLALNIRWRRPLVSATGLTLLIAATLWGLHWKQEGNFALWGAVLAAESLGMAVLACLGGKIAPAGLNRNSTSISFHDTFLVPLSRCGEGIAWLALMAALWAGFASRTWAVEHVITGSCLVISFFLLAALEQRSGMARLAGLMLIGTATAAAGWWAGPENGFSASLIALWVALAGVCLAAMAVCFEPPAKQGGEVGSPEEKVLRSRWYWILAAAWRQTGALGGLLALGLLLAFFTEGKSPLPTEILAIVATTAFLLAWGYSSVTLTWVGSGLALGSITHLWLFAVDQRDPSTPLLATAFLVHATLALTFSFVIGIGPQLSALPEKISLNRKLQQLLGLPLGHTALASSILALAVLWVPGWGTTWGVSLCLFWLAALWLWQSVANRWPVLFAGFQAVLCLAVLVATTAWLESQPWFQVEGTGHWLDPWTWQAYGIELGLLSLVWVTARIFLRSSRVARRLLEPECPAIDRVVLSALVVGQLALAVACILPGILGELQPIGSGPATFPWLLTPSHAFGWGAWGLLAIVALVMVVGLHERQAAASMVGLVVAALSVPVLNAGQFMGQQATIPALCWGWGSCFLVYSLPLWFRNHLYQVAKGPGRRVRRWPALLPVIQTLLLLGLVIPVLLVTLRAWGLRSQGIVLPEPLAGSFFGRLSWLVASVTPLVMIAAGLVGHAIREGSPRFAFSGGLIANLTVTGGYALSFLRVHRPLDQTQGVYLVAQIVQLVVIVASLWAIAWLAVRSRLRTVQGGQESPQDQPLLQVQTGIGAAGNIGLIGLALILLVLLPTAQDWTIATGSALGWAALFLATAAVALHLRQRQSSLSPQTVGLVGMAVIGLLACTVERWFPNTGWSYRTLMMGWAAYPLAVAIAAWRLLPEPKEGEEGPAREWINGTTFWVSAASPLAVLLGCKAALWQNDLRWAAGAIAVASAAGAVVAVWRKWQDWAFRAGLGINLSASLLVWDFHGRLGLPLQDWWVHLLQANVLASAAVALLWLGIRQKLFGHLERFTKGSPYLQLQIILGLVGNAVLLGQPILFLLVQPGKKLPDPLLQTGETGGWLAMVLAWSAAQGYFRQFKPRLAAEGLCLLSVGLASLAACTAARFDQGNWLGYHVLTAGWTLSCVTCLTIANFKRGSTPAKVGSEIPSVTTIQSGLTALRPWIVGTGLFVLVLAVRGTWDDPQRPYYSASATLILSIVAGYLAVRLNLPAFVYVSGLLLNAAATMAWVSWGVHSIDYFTYTQILAFTIGALVWSGLELGLRKYQGGLDFRSQQIPYAQAAMVVALCLLGTLVVGSLYLDLGSEQVWTAGLLAWGALALTAAAVGLSLWNSSAGLTMPGLYAVGLMAIGLGLHTGHPNSVTFAWVSALSLAGFALLAAAISWSWPRLTALRQALSLPDHHEGSADFWFLPAQALVACVVIFLSLGLSLGAISLLERWTGPVAVALLVPAEILLVGQTPGERRRTELRYATLVLGVIATVEAAWASLDPGIPALWLHRSVLLMVSLIVVTLGYGVGLPRLLRNKAQLPEENKGTSTDSLVPWGNCARRLGPLLGILASLVLLAVMVQEGLLYDPSIKQTPMVPAAVGIVGVALIALIVAGICFAVLPGQDPFALSARGRMAYVYGGEVVLVLLFLHLKLNVPFLFGQFGARYWTLIVMGIAFAGVGLSEFFQRRGLGVLAEPMQRTGIFLPLLPLLAFWAHPPAVVQEFARERLPGMHPMLDYLTRIPHHLGQYAVLWFLLGLLYMVVAITRRSFLFALLGALAANVGLWFLLTQSGLAFLLHPQMWLIPLALIALVAEHLNRDRLTANQSTMLRYLALIVIYVSSSADMFIDGLGHSWVLPLVLTILSVLGILGGMLLRVRAFLFLGTTFLLLVIITMIWHAGVDLRHTWILWASGIVLGVAILALFGLFEKRRNDVLQLVEELKEWH